MNNEEIARLSEIESNLTCKGDEWRACNYEEDVVFLLALIDKLKGKL